MKLWCTWIVGFLSLVAVIDGTTTDAPFGRSPKSSLSKLVEFQSSRSQSFIRTWRRASASAASLLDSDPQTSDGRDISDERSTTSALMQAVQIVAEADKGLLVQLLLNMFVTLNGLVEYLVSSKFQYTVRSQCLSAMMLSQCFEIFRSSRLNFDYLTEPDIDSLILNEAKNSVSSGLIKFGGHIIAFSAIAILSGAKSGSLLPVLLFLIPFYFKYMLLLLLTRRQLLVRSAINKKSSISTSSKRPLIQNAAQVTPVSESVLRAVAVVAPSLLADMARETVPGASSFDYLVPTRANTTSHTPLSSDSKTSANTSLLNATACPVDSIADPLDRVLELTSAAAEALYLLGAAVGVLTNLSQQRVSGVLDLAMQWLLLFLSAQYLFVRVMTSIASGALPLSAFVSNVGSGAALKQVTQVVNSLLTSGSLNKANSKPTKKPKKIVKKKKKKKTPKAEEKESADMSLASVDVPANT